MKIVRKELGKTFSERIVALALSIPSGCVTTYGMIARAAGGGGQAARSVTAILGKAYDAGERNIPFHRIVYAGGRVWLNPQYRSRRLALYKKEGIELDVKGYIKNFDDILFEFK
ncbi:MAG TPA: MGMT family protein [Candidatus Paceibacterota bacterium]|nr:MGMT family protein [Candidatus Paceibacterota bacterium]